MFSSKLKYSMKWSYLHATASSLIMNVNEMPKVVSTIGIFTNIAISEEDKIVEPEQVCDLPEIPDKMTIEKAIKACGREGRNYILMPTIGICNHHTVCMMNEVGAITTLYVVVEECEKLWC